MKYKIIFEKQDKNLKQRFKKAFLKLMENPYPSSQMLNIKKLKGSKKYRLRISNFYLGNNSQIIKDI